MQNGYKCNSKRINVYRGKQKISDNIGISLLYFWAQTYDLKTNFIDANERCAITLGKMSSLCTLLPFYGHNYFQICRKG